jgi:hypothetical protein
MQSQNHTMADWKQITARIRRARTGKDPVAQLSNLFEKTRDAMVAFELARHFETSGQNAEAAKWYSAAAERFRRADWKTKALEAAARLGGAPAPENPASESDTVSATSPVISVPEPGLPFEQNAAVFEAVVAPQEDAPGEPAVPPVEPAGHTGRRRRGRRGGRSRHRGGAAKDAATTAAPATHTEHASAHRPTPAAPVDETPEQRSIRTPESPALRLPVEPLADAGGIALRGRYGDPGLSSRLSLLEMQFRRLLTCAPVKLDEAASAPAGPGVFLLTDSDLTTYYYVEDCQTLRIAIPNLLRGGSSRRGADSIKPQLADHLGIAESRVAKYLADHCVVRWLQLDEGASHFAHFVIAVLRPVLNE